MQDELMELQRTVHKTIIFITHDLSEALKLGDQVAVMKDGRIVQIGSPQNIVSEPTDDYVAAFTQDVDRGRVFTVGSIIREIEPLLEREDTVETALSRMRENNLDALHVVDEDSKPVGIVTRQAVGVATREGVRDLGRVINTEYPATGASETLADVYDLTAAGLPIAVLDEEGTLIGVVDATDMIGNLTPDTDTEPLKVVM
jgi:glycine betaine/proline transport system ATP-binding protein